ncbi:hypothetical protein AK812_SmicGene9573 [Symbiodinium microadriaticum]|uniref:Uncharacterized protein n=1 Tax=Symbiodinium microadriaticum TaxID=2951 RepID=A0A1Q9EI49_SYMMI|nr:hypothetical protein AK812_SmicGene9573 [Symbiodinium microadriaticum]
MRKPLQYAWLMHHRILRLESFGQEFLSSSQQVLDKDNGDACDMLLLQVQQETCSLGFCNLKTVFDSGSGRILVRENDAQEVVREHGGVVLNPGKGRRASRGSKQSNGDKCPETRGKGTTLSHSSLARDSDIGPGACWPIPYVLVQGHDEGEFRLQNVGRLEFLFKNASINCVEGLASVDGQCDSPLTGSGDASRGASLLKSDPLRRYGSPNTMTVMQSADNCMFNATPWHISVLWPGPRRLREGRTQLEGERFDDDTTSAFSKGNRPQVLWLVRGFTWLSEPRDPGVRPELVELMRGLPESVAESGKMREKNVFSKVPQVELR